MTKQQDYFWQQYDGLVRAIDLPQWYKRSDKRIYCVNGACFFRSRCLFWNRYTTNPFHIKESDIRKEQADGIQRSKFDKNYPLPHYSNASFGFYAEQQGATPCDNFIELKDNDYGNIE